MGGVLSDGFMGSQNKHVRRERLASGLFVCLFVRLKNDPLNSTRVWFLYQK